MKAGTPRRQSSALLGSFCSNSKLDLRRDSQRAAGTCCVSFVANRAQSCRSALGPASVRQCAGDCLRCAVCIARQK